MASKYRDLELLDHEYHEHHDRKEIQESPLNSDSLLILLATNALKEWKKRSAVTDAMIWGAGITNAVKSYKDFTALKSPQGLQRLVVVSGGRPQFKLVRRSITIPRMMAAKHRIGAGPIRVRLFVKVEGETWNGTEEEECFTSAWLDLPRKYRIRISNEHEEGRKADWSFWYRPTQKGLKAKRAAMELMAGLDEMVRANRAMRSMNIVRGYIKKHHYDMDGR
jgi:ribosomal protein L31E